MAANDKPVGVAGGIVGIVVLAGLLYFLYTIFGTMIRGLIPTDGIIIDACEDNVLFSKDSTHTSSVKSTNYKGIYVVTVDVSGSNGRRSRIECLVKQGANSWQWNLDPDNRRYTNTLDLWTWRY